MRNEPARGTLTKGSVFLEKDNAANLLHDRGSFGVRNTQRHIELSLIEAYYLLTKGKIHITSKSTLLDEESFLRRAKRIDRRFRVKYALYETLRDRGYILKTALKYGADFRVYEKGVRPGDNHSRWLAYAVSETEYVSLTDFVAKNRVAHSARKKLLLGIIDNELSVTLYEIGWVKL